jgi:hypothetical protein
MMKNDHFSVYLAGRLIGVAEDVEEDWPWSRGKFIPTADFQSVKALFDDEYRYLQQKATVEHDEALQKIWSLDFRLESPVHGTATGCAVDKAEPNKNIVMVHIHGGKIRWRS